NRRIAPEKEQHVVDGFFGFLENIGLTERELNWQLPIPSEAEAFADRHIDASRPTLIISPCSSHALRDWSAINYAAVADHAIAHHGMQVILCGGPSRREHEMGVSTERHMRQRPLNLIGKDTLKRMLALLQRADALITPDSGPAHMATCVDTPVIGLYAASNSRRSGPYLSTKWCVDKYDEAATRFLGKSPEDIPWGTKIERQGVMSLVSIEDVVAKLDAVLGMVHK
ncbi:MAG: glycosyltransferase family 9 protein, partial [Gammaproteobacteria bacterium]